MVNTTKIELKFIPDPGMFIFFEKGMRDGVCYVSNGFSKANNNYLKSQNQNKNQNILYIQT